AMGRRQRRHLRLFLHQLRRRPDHPDQGKADPDQRSGGRVQRYRHRDDHLLTRIPEMHRLKNTLRAIASTALLILATQAAAASLQVAPTSVVLHPTQKAEAVWLSN